MFNFFKKKPIVPAVMPFKTDIHCHIVPGVDDGSPDVDTSVALVERLMSMGIERIFASPHVTEDTFENTPEILDDALRSLNDALHEREVGMQVMRSAEYRIDEFFNSQLEAGNVTPLPNNFILVENSFIQEPWGLDNFLFNLKLKGYKPILAHPERYVYYSEKSHRGRYDQLHALGILFQVNMLSFAGRYGKAERDAAMYLLEKGYISFLGTDMHGHSHADTLEAYLSSKEYGKVAEALKKAAKNDIWI